MTVHEALAKLRVLMENAIGGRRTLNDHKTWLRRDQERLNGYWDAFDALVAHVDTLTRERDEAVETYSKAAAELTSSAVMRAEAAGAAIEAARRALEQIAAMEVYEAYTRNAPAVARRALAAGDTEETT